MTVTLGWIILAMILYISVGLPLAMYSQIVRNKQDSFPVFILAVATWPLWLAGLLLEADHRR